MSTGRKCTCWFNRNQNEHRLDGRLLRNKSKSLYLSHIRYRAEKIIFFVYPSLFANWGQSAGSGSVQHSRRVKGLSILLSLIMPRSHPPDICQSGRVKVIMRFLFFLHRRNDFVSLLQSVNQYIRNENDRHLKLTAYPYPVGDGLRICSGA